MQKEGKQSNNTSIVAQDIIMWQHFCRGRVSNKLTSAMEKYYSNHSDNPNFTGRRLTKNIIALVLTIHVEEWHLRCHSLTSPENPDDDKLSPEKISLLLTIKLFYEKIGSLPVSNKNSLITLRKSIEKVPVQNFKQWIKNTKRIFKMNNEKSKDR